MAIKTIEDCLGYQQITNLASSTALTIPEVVRDGKLVRPTRAVIRCETQSVRWRDDGTAPAAGVGMLMLAADLPYCYEGDLTAIRFIETAASAKLNIAYYR